ncbi:MAG TPA: efflux RND transporter periplasmic adaptor subunit [Kofleriaceae bacterium]|jgi:RND family efflux transporter MFP subunit|nr:efflux RND transporter periplasmic adaptor subunit [Kofleriaceae bacterium]
MTQDPTLRGHQDAGSPSAEAHASEDLGFALPPPSRTSRTGVIVVLAIMLGGGLAFGLSQRGKAHERTALPAPTSRATHVQVIKPKLLDSDHALALPGTVRALEQTKIFPRVTGYVRRWLVDIGDKVTAGQLLVEIETPDLDAQLAQARAQLGQAQAAVKQVTAQRNYSRSNTQRFESLADQQLVSKSQVEQTQAQASTDEANVTAAEANVTAQQANVRRLVETQAFARVVAPFTGRITTRTVERGDLVTEGTGTVLYTLVAIDPIRVFVEVPQTVAPSVRTGIEATVVCREFPGRKFPGKVTRAAGALDPDLHTMTTEVQVPNPDGTLLPGMYVQTELTLPVPHRVVEIPATALYSDAQGLRVAVVDGQQKAHFAPITIERDTGATLQVATGLGDNDRVVKIAVPGLAEGDPLEVDEAGSAARVPGAPGAAGAAAK